MLPIYRTSIFTILFIITGSLQAQFIEYKNDIVVGAQRVSTYLPLLKDKRVAIVANQTSMIGKTHLVDSLMALKVNITKVFTLEHGFRGKADAGEKIQSAKDEKTGLTLVSLYGANKKPSAEQLKDVDIVIFDIQDVGARFFTYISSLHYIMEACAEHKKTVLILDRPNPNGFYVDGPVLETKYKSFVGMHPVPVVHGMTVGEYAQMINGEGWLNGKKCDLKIITCENYTHNDLYELPIPPSPNLKTMTAIYLYPSTCYFEGTNVSVGRGTDHPFQFIGTPGFKEGKVSFTPTSREGAKTPPLQDKKCTGFLLKEEDAKKITETKKIDISWLQKMYAGTPDKKTFFIEKGSFNILAGNATLKQQIINGKSEQEIRKSWEPALGNFKSIRKKYLLYPDFE